MNKYIKTGIAAVIILGLLTGGRLLYVCCFHEKPDDTSTIPYRTEDASTVPYESEDEPESGTKNDTETENNPEETEVFILPDLEYGKASYEYVKTIDQKFPYRVTGNPKYSSKTKDNCGKWIKKTMEGFGYKAEVQSYRHDNGKNKMKVTSYVFRKKGKKKQRIVIGAHYDSRESHGAEDNGTGIGMLLELAERFSDIDTDLSIDFCFWDGEELRGYAGSYYYVKTCKDPENIDLYMNLDCLGCGDTMFVYGGRYEGKELVQDEGLELALKIGEALDIPLSLIPKLKEPEFKTPIRLTGSDQYYFAKAKIPYVYFEANAWVNEKGEEQYPNGNMPYQYNTNDPALRKTEGQINHMEFDEFDKLQKLFPGRMQDHLEKYSKILTLMLLKLCVK